MVIPYNYLDQIILLSRYRKEPVKITQTTLNSFGVKSGNYEIKFSDYVNSQVHLNVVSSFFGREMSQYVNASREFKFNTDYACAKSLLPDFYLDMRNFLMSNPDNVKLNIIVDIPNEEVIDVDVGSTRRALIYECIRWIKTHNNEMPSCITEADLKDYDDWIVKNSDEHNCYINWIINNCLSVNECIENVDNYALAYSLNDILENEPHSVYSFKGVDYVKGTE